MVEVFMGDLEDLGFDYEKGNWNGNIPKRVSGFFPKSHDSFRFVLKQINDKLITGKQTDWGSWITIMYPKDVMDLFANFYDEYHLCLLQEVLEELDENKKYGLVACEMR